MADVRELLIAYVREAKVMQLSTLDEDGAPYVNNLWFASAFGPDRLYFISRPTRVHSENIRARPRVAGAVLSIELVDPSHPVRGVTFAGTAAELPTMGIDEAVAVYAGRWPTTARAIDPERLASGAAHHRVYEVTVTSWTLYDEEHFRADPRQPVEAR
ncbi:pyridoxamine 5'-phosphate oxidase family protein [Dactylosporangium sp. AC04546]|uniref:pyridoxamine 5'-phosphate oxidase family protein n=1 Tax=Dactylosporangium sp. AC04546 TaxID=2862460 RepID=UPI001EDEF433|nr:pyridoxamine 5'-phosphate oxidase family protein [Dactylosporangium sp. AC04546]WVK88261.1 pyridoxamine 5'-phosphate oxidase family protein [Dactylosporangium sp. AC04546]